MKEVIKPLSGAPCPMPLSSLSVEIHWWPAKEKFPFKNARQFFRGPGDEYPKEARGHQRTLEQPSSIRPETVVEFFNFPRRTGRGQGVRGVGNFPTKNDQKRKTGGRQWKV